MSLRAAVAILALAAGVITGMEILTVAGPEAHRSSSEPAAALLWSDDADGPEAVGTQPPRNPAVGRAIDVARVRSVVLAVAVLAAGVARLRAHRRSCLWTGREFVVRGALAWAGPGGRRAPPLAAAS
ncbi:MAG: hypothetical protein ACRD0V_01265 [Acidimicrobiales bacterium]